MRRKGKWPRVERVRSPQIEEGGYELGGSGEGSARRAGCSGVVVVKKWCGSW